MAFRVPDSVRGHEYVIVKVLNDDNMLGLIVAKLRIFKNPAVIRLLGTVPSVLLQSLQAQMNRSFRHELNVIRLEQFRDFSYRVQPCQSD
jgi:predicted metalloprotease